MTRYHCPTLLVHCEKLRCQSKARFDELVLCGCGSEGFRNVTVLLAQLNDGIIAFAGGILLYAALTEG